MTATNHVVTGALIGAVVSNPVVAVPLAFLSHFVLDSLPHYDSHAGHTSRNFVLYLAADCAFAASVLLSLMVLQPHNWLVLVACGVVGASPDLMWLPRWIVEMKGKEPQPMGPIRRFHAKIQWAANKWGIFFELPWFCVTIATLLVITSP